jgi:hypothetical protein
MDCYIYKQDNSPLYFKWMNYLFFEFFFRSEEDLPDEALLSVSCNLTGWFSAALIIEDTLPPEDDFVLGCFVLRLLTPFRPMSYSLIKQSAYCRIVLRMTRSSVCSKLPFGGA